MGDLIYEDLTYKIRGALFEVYREKGAGFVEGVYQECLEIEMGIQKIPFTAQYPLQLLYKGCQLNQKFIPDFVIEDKIILEIKAVRELKDEHRCQVQNYLKATGYKLGFLVNFGHFPKLQIERIAN